MTWQHRVKRLSHDTRSVFVLASGVLTAIILGVFAVPVALALHGAKNSWTHMNWFQRVDEDISDVLLFTVWLYVGYIPGFIIMLISAVKVWSNWEEQ